ncbi:MAG: hypothetical protein M1826_002344 [Phylliscum demangeonii]|nr:MAG: hypothetical protein M1826_002344 [Phylliscum demangeonii]
MTSHRSTPLSPAGVDAHVLPSLMGEPRTISATDADHVDRALVVVCRETPAFSPQIHSGPR